MNRRHYLGYLGVALAGVLGGCSAPAAPNGENGGDRNGATTTDPEIDSDASQPYPNSSACSFTVAIVNDAPDDATVYDAGERNLRDSDLIDRALERAADPEEHGQSEQQSDTYRTLSVEADSEAEFEAAESALDGLDRYDFEDPTYPGGVYIAGENATVAMWMLCLT